ncbi:DoxX family protein [Nocardia gipuzkoensis]|uniref:DoxX family protein n=1 Tax=Nocardia gipuzkoensis TaxID=2749991 RepID=UPI001E2DDD50|nr:DoxX family protein [Nocardia gipuzkoensis]UGT67866.1 DoxX family protein [Nocardia gipuzkoensis]
MTATTILAALLAIVLLGAGTTMILAISVQRDTAAHLGFRVNAFRRIGVLEVLGAIGVLLGLKIPTIGVLAAVGVVALMVGAAISHLRVRDRLPQLIPPMAIAAVGVAYLILIGQQAVS